MRSLKIVLDYGVTIVTRMAARMFTSGNLKMERNPQTEVIIAVLIHRVCCQSASVIRYL